MDAAQERQFRRRQKEEDLRLEQAERLAEELEIKKQREEARRREKYKGK